MSGRSPSPAGASPTEGSVAPSAAHSSTPKRSPALATTHVPPPTTQAGFARSTSASAVPTHLTAGGSPSIMPSLRPAASSVPLPPPTPPALGPAPVPVPASATPAKPAPAPAPPAHVQEPSSVPSPILSQAASPQPSQQRSSLDSDVVEKRWQELTQQREQSRRAQIMPRQVQAPPPQPIQQHQQPPPQQYAWKTSQRSPSPQPSYPANQPLPHTHQPQRPPHTPLRPPDPVIGRRAPIVNRPPQGPPPPAPPRVEPIYSDPRGGIPHPSPGHDYARENPKIQEDYMRLTFAIEQSVSAAVRCAIRQNWQKCLTGTSFHQGFMLNALLDSAPPDVAKGSIKDFGRRVAKTARAEFAAHLDTADIDEIAGILLAKASNQFLDAALEARLRTIDAKPLINALARAERLGYEPDDIVEEPVGGQERVIPQNVPEPPPPTSGPAPPHMKQCRMCNRVFDKEPPYVYHVANQVCMQRPEGPEGFLFSCSNCGQGFENNYALTYHNSTGACSKYETPSDAVPAPKPPTAMPSAAWPSTTMSPEPAPNGAVGGNYGQSQESAFPAAQPTATPVRIPPSLQTGSPSGPGLKTPTSDPYAHLSEAQLAALNEELHKAEKMYTEKFREAEEIADPAERQTIIGNLKNSFGTRQSIIRKKWGVRLRERRTKAEIEAEKARMGLLRGAKDSSPTTGGSYGNRSTPTSSQGNGTSYDSVKRMRTDDGSGSQHGTGPRGSFNASEPKRKTPTPAYHMLETPRAQPLPRPVDNDDDDANNSDSSSDDDIPARLPDSVRQSLSASQRL